MQFQRALWNCSYFDPLQRHSRFAIHNRDVVRPGVCGAGMFAENPAFSVRAHLDATSGTPASGTAPLHEPKPEAPCRRPALHHSFSPLVEVSSNSSASRAWKGAMTGASSMDFGVIAQCSQVIRAPKIAKVTFGRCDRLLRSACVAGPVPSSGGFFNGLQRQESP